MPEDKHLYLKGRLYKQRNQFLHAGRLVEQ
jgi:hypothetical protein